MWGTLTSNLRMRCALGACGVCPLTRGYPLEALQPAFSGAAAAAWTLPMQDSDLLDHSRGPYALGDRADRRQRAGRALPAASGARR